MNKVKRLGGELRSTYTNSRSEKKYHEENTNKVISKYLIENNFSKIITDT